MRMIWVGSLQVRKDTTGGDNIRKHTTVGGRKKHRWEDSGRDTLTDGLDPLPAHPCHKACPAVCRKRGVVFLTLGPAPPLG